MLGEMLIELKQAQHALVELEAVMKKEPNRFRTYYHAARAASLTGDKAKASQYYKRLVDMCPKGTRRALEFAEARVRQELTCAGCWPRSPAPRSSGHWPSGLPAELISARQACG